VPAVCSHDHGHYRFELDATNPDAPVLTITRQ
jgi:hypothetical protein